jgi:2-keto-4-pentenoate hydratase/2-oxohepta-3-ene-1,7-dioic acid hydratase in catechol pathway
MRFITFEREDGLPHIGVVRGDNILDLNIWFSAHEGALEYTHLDMVDFIAQEYSALERARTALLTSDAELRNAGALVPLEEAVLLAPIPRPRKNVMCMGRNYAEHTAESMRAFKEGEAPTERPEYPSIFTKATTSINAPFGDIPFDPTLSEQIDWEVELAVVIGKSGKNIRHAEAMGYVFGYMVLNDISARDIQMRHANQYFKGKSLDGACPTGPWIVTADEISNPNDLQLTLRVNGVVKQRDRTSSMLFDIAEIIEQMSWGMTLEPGDIIATGTPAGIGMARTPPEYLKPGDIVECDIEGIGAIRNRVVAD